MSDLKVHLFTQEGPDHLLYYRSDTIKLTALFTARRGRAFMYAISQREARNFEFEFLRPTSPLFGYFNALVEQYSKVLLPPPELREKITRGTEPDARWKMLEISHQHAEWERARREKEKKRHDDKEAERSESFMYHSYDGCL